MSMPPGPGGLCGCDAGSTACPGAQVSVDVANRVITFTGLRVAGVIDPTLSCTLDGQICF